MPNQRPTINQHESDEKYLENKYIYIPGTTEYIYNGIYISKYHIIN